MRTSPRRIISTIILVVLVALCCIGIIGCSAGKGHQVVPVGKECVECHDDKPAYQVESPRGSIASGGTVTVKSNAQSISVCTPVFTSEDGSSYTPVEARTVAVSDNVATVSLEPGTWAICVKKDDASIGQIVVVSAESSESPTITL